MDRDKIIKKIGLDNLAEAYQEQGRILEAEATYRQSLGIIREGGTAVQQWRTLRRLALLREEQKDMPGARALVQEAVVLLGKKNKTKPLAEAQELLARLVGHTGDRSMRGWWRRVISIAFGRWRRG